jgi:glycine/D-amino acid oxidase-like deaminating enzyme
MRVGQLQRGLAAMHGEVPADQVTRSWSAAIRPPENIPSSAEILIIGGGIVGVSTAWFLASQGIDVVLCEKGHIAGEQSGRNWGWVRQQGRDRREVPMIMESLNIWRGLADEIGEDVGFVQGGCLFATRDAKRLEEYAGWLPTAAEYGLDTRLVSATEIARIVRGSTMNWKGGIFTASDGRAEPHKATRAIARAAERRGATILTGCAVRGLETSAGRVSAVVTEHGVIKAPVVLCAAGAWTSMFCRALDICLPQLNIRGTVARTAPGPGILDGCLWGDRLGVRRRQDGGYTVVNDTSLQHSITPSTFRFAFKFLPALMQERQTMRLSIGSEFFTAWKQPRQWKLDTQSPFEITRVLNPAPDWRSVRGTQKMLGSLFPQLAGIGSAEAWCGMVETVPDVVPVIDEADTLPGFYIATGFSGHGFGIGPGAGKAVSGMLTGSGSGIDLSAFRLSRFFDGTRIRPHQTI